MIAVVVILMNLIADLLYAVLDPRVGACAEATAALSRPVRRVFTALRRCRSTIPFAIAGLVDLPGLRADRAIFADRIAPYDPTEILFTADYTLAADLHPGVEGHILGTTSLGRDIFSQLVYGSRSALLIGVTAAFMVALIGTLVGLRVGLFRRLGRHRPDARWPTSPSASRSCPS